MCSSQVSWTFLCHMTSSPLVSQLTIPNTFPWRPDPHLVLQMWLNLTEVSLIDLHMSMRILIIAYVATDPRALQRAPKECPPPNSGVRDRRALPFPLCPCYITPSSPKLHICNAFGESNCVNPAEGSLRSCSPSSSSSLSS